MLVEDLIELASDDAYREALAAAAYFRECVEEAAVDAEHTLERRSYWALSWDSLTDDVRRPYRTAVAEALDNIMVACVTADERGGDDAPDE